MGDYKLPELPSDEELGITDADREAYGEGSGEADASGARADAPPADEKARKKAERKAAKAEKKAAKAERKAAKREGPGQASPSRAWPGRWQGPVTLLLLLVASWVASSRTGMPSPVPASAPDTAFSSARAMSMLVEIASQAHPTGSPEHTRVRAYLVDRLRSLGLDPQVQTATSVLETSGGARSATVRNVVARLPGTGSTGAVVLTAHYDSRGIARGAGDDGTGVVTILEAVRALRAGEPVRNDVIVLFTDAEELGLLGARAFVRGHPWMRDVSLVLSFEMRGAGGPTLVVETNDQNGWIVRALGAFAERPVAYSLASEVYDRLPNDTDFTPFAEAGVQGVSFAAIGRANVYHQSYDEPARVSESTLQHHGLQALAGLRYLGNADLQTVDAPDLAYFTVPLLGLVAYRQVLGLALAAGLLALLAGGVVLARRKGARLPGLAVGLGLSVVVGALSFGTASLLRGWLPRFHPEHGSLFGALFHDEGWYVVALLGAAFALITGVHALARRWLRPEELELGALALPALAGVVLAVAMPAGAPMVQWPALAALLAVVLPLVLGERLRSTVGWAVAVVLAAVVLAFAVPLVELLWAAVSFDAAGLLAVLMAASLYLLLPALDALRGPNPWWAPLTGLVVAGVALGGGILSAGASAEEPAPSTLAYAYEHGTGSAVWVTAPAGGAPDGTGAEGGATAGGGAADAPAGSARAWALERAGAEFSGTRDLSGFGYLRGDVPVAPAPVVSAAPPDVRVIGDTVEGAARRVRLGVRSAIGAEMLRFQLDPSGDVRILAINGEALTIPGTVEWVDHWGVPDSMVVLDLEMPAAAPIDLHVVEHLLRPEELLGAGTFARPPGLAPDVTRLSDRAMFRFSVAAFADPRYGLIRRPGSAVPPPAADTAATPGTRVAPPDTGLVPDTGAAADTVVSPDTGTEADTIVPPDTGTAADTLAPPDTGTAPGAVPPDTVAPPDTGTVSPLDRPASSMRSDPPGRRPSHPMGGPPC